MASLFDVGRIPEFHCFGEKTAQYVTQHAAMLTMRLAEFPTRAGPALGSSSI
jgi:hypothetical protein